MSHRFLTALLGTAFLAGCSASGRLLSLIETSPEGPKRLQAVEQLGQRSYAGPQEEKVVAALSAATRDGDEQVRLKALETLGKLHTKAARATLVSALNGRDFQEAALREYDTALKLGGDSPEVLLGMARIQTDLDKLDDARRSLLDAGKLVETMDSYQAGRYLSDLKYGLDNLRMKYEPKGDRDAADKLLPEIAKWTAKVEEMEKQRGGAGGLGGMPYPMVQ
ncbi:MAG: HEAT repeat domain-containing protein [Armatimonadetes bacterium]|nr:HEAT repeat domain-containing protein [Armatimonadota bacterium]